MDPNNAQSLENFVQCMEEANEIIKDNKPDIIIAPMFGAVPFIDVLNVIDSDFPNERVEYVSASNKVHKVATVLRATFENIIRARTPNGGTYISIDEVVSGNSLVRVHKQFSAARQNHSNAETVKTYGTHTDFTKPEVRQFRDEIKEGIVYQTIAVVDSRMRRNRKRKVPSYTRLVESGVAIPVDTDCIVTMDRAPFFPAKYKRAKDNQGKTVFLPVVDHFDVSEKYIDFLQEVASVIGKDPEVVTLSNMGKIRNSYHWVPKELREV